MAFMNIGAVVGPLLGIFVGGLCLEMLWVDIESDVELDSSDQNWIGAWWLPYFANGLLGLIMCLPVFGFPNQFPGQVFCRKSLTVYRKRKPIGGSHEIKKERAEASPVEQSSDGSFLVDLKLIMTNPVWILATIGSICDSFMTADSSVKQY